ncbi:MAG: F0F1 ATP synthase subunit B', partial [Enhydrobacter sp.]
MKKSVYSVLTAALAVGASGAAQAAEGGMPQLNFHDFAPQLIWLLIAFVVLYLIMSRLAVPAIADTLEKRQAKIQGDLDAAEKASEDTRAAVDAYQKRLANAREEARGLTRARS